MKVRDEYSAEEFESLLEEAEARATSEWDMNFVSDMRAKWEDYGTEMYLSDRQQEQIERIAEGG